MFRFAPLLFVLAACPVSPAPPPPPTTSPPPSTEPPPTEPPPIEPSPTQAGAELTSKDACTTHADCEITTFSGCCACPGCDQTNVRSTKELAAAKQMCAAIRCDMERCKTMLCKPAEPIASFRAACQNNVCVGIRR